MKEYLRENPKGVFKVIPYDSSRSGDIEIPEGADVCVNHENGKVYFWKNDGADHWVDELKRFSSNSSKYTTLKEFLSEWSKSKIIWQRKKTIESNIEQDSVSHPKHYTSDDCGVEAIEITSLLPACISNATKYIWREGKKDSPIQELEKALWYINYSIGNNLPSTVNDLTDSMHFEELITKVKKHWSGWKYVFIDAVYWGDQQQMKRAVEGMIADINTN